MINRSKDLKISFLDFVFSKTKDKVKVHGLAATSNWIIERWPFYSVDSSSWLSAARFGSIKGVDNKMLSYLSKTKHHTDNTKLNLQAIIKHNKFVTRLWEKRGIKWE